MTDLDPTRTERTVVLSVDVSTDQELAAVHEALSRAAAGFVCDGRDARVYVWKEDDEDGELSLVGPPDPSAEGDRA